MKHSQRQSAIPPTYLLAAMVGATVLASAAACDTNQPAVNPQYIGVCIDRVTQQRVPDEQCGAYAGGAAVAVGDEWDYVNTALYPSWEVPAYGAHISTTHVTIVHSYPATATVYRGVPRAGGAVSVVRARSALVTARPAGSGGSLGQGTAKSTITRGGFGVPGGKTTSVSAGS